jgi:hypothetical protein
MISKAKIAANRKNAARSTGPRSAEGKARASRNAYRHGLAVSVLNDPAISAEVEVLARAILGKRNNSWELLYARIVAEAELDLVRVRATRKKLVDAALAGESSGGIEAAERAAQPHVVDDTRFESLLRALPQLELLERYERRAFSRRRPAFREMYASRV